MKPQTEDLAIHNQNESPVVNLVNKILSKAIEQKASEIHIEPQKDGLHIRFRKQGVLAQAFEPLSKKISGVIVNRLKVIGNLDIAKRNVPQEGKIERLFQGNKINMTINTVPTNYGEKAVIHLFCYSQKDLELSILVSEKNTETIIANLLKYPKGLLLLTGTDTDALSKLLYSLLLRKNKAGSNICTVEQQIKLYLQGITQVEVKKDNKLDYPTIIKSFLAQDVDIILVDQIRDSQTAKSVVEAAISGHLVLASLPSKDTVNTILTLKSLGIDSKTIADTLIGIIRQKTLRRVCDKCRIKYDPSSELDRVSPLASMNFKGKQIYKAKTLNEEQIETARANFDLCYNCEGMGYIGQISAYEVFSVSPSIKLLISNNKEPELVYRKAINEGMKTLYDYGCKLVEQGYTTLEELETVLPKEIGDIKNMASADEKMISPTGSGNIWKRLEQLEQQLLLFTEEIKLIKQELITGKYETEPELNLTEELADPGSWEELKKELEFDDSQQLQTPQKRSPEKKAIELEELEELKEENDPYLFSPDTIKFEDTQKAKQQEQKPTFSVGQKQEEIPDPW